MSDDPKGVKLPPPNTNRGRLAHRAFTLAKLLALNAPHILILNAKRMVDSAFMDCESYGYEDQMTFARANEIIQEEALREEAEHRKNHMDGPPVEDCSWCMMPDLDP